VCVGQFSWFQCLSFSCVNQEVGTVVHQEAEKEEQQWKALLQLLFCSWPSRVESRRSKRRLSGRKLRAIKWLTWRRRPRQAPARQCSSEASRRRRKKNTYLPIWRNLKLANPAQLSFTSNLNQIQLSSLETSSAEAKFQLSSRGTSAKVHLSASLHLRGFFTQQKLYSTESPQLQVFLEELRRSSNFHAVSFFFLASQRQANGTERLCVCV